MRKKKNIVIHKLQMLNFNLFTYKEALHDATLYISSDHVAEDLHHQSKEEIWKMASLA